MTQQSVKEQVNDWYLNYSKDIHQYIFFLTNDHEQSKDLMQETFLRAYNRYDSFQGENCRGWLFKIARNVTIDFVRRKKPISYLLESFPMLKSNHANPEQILSYTETERELYMALEKLKGPYRDVIILRKIEEFSIQETCQILGWSESKVKSSLLRGMKALKKQYEKEGAQHEAI